jgi:hypothetical protein
MAASTALTVESILLYDVMVRRHLRNALTMDAALKPAHAEAAE